MQLQQKSCWNKNHSWCWSSEILTSINKQDINCQICSFSCLDVGMVTSCNHAQEKRQARLIRNLGHQTQKVLLGLHNNHPISSFQRCPSSETNPFPSTDQNWKGTKFSLSAAENWAVLFTVRSQPSMEFELCFCLELSESRIWFWETYVLHELWKSPWVKHSGVFWTQKLEMEVTCGNSGLFGETCTRHASLITHYEQRQNVPLCQ